VATQSSTGPNLDVTVDTARAKAALDALENYINRFGTKAVSSFDRVTSSLAKFEAQANKSGMGIEKLFQRFTELAGIYTAIRAFEGFLGKLIEVNRAYTGFIASMSVVRGSVGAAAKEYEFLLSMSNRLGVEVETSITQYHRLAAALKNVDTTGEFTRQVFTGLSEAAVVLHSRGRDVTLIFEAVQQMASKGKLSLEELQRQLGNTLPGAVATMARAMMSSQSFIEKGITTTAAAERELRAQIKAGTINVYEAILRFSNQLKKDYGEGVKYAADQFQANFNRMKNSVFEFYRVVGASGAMNGLTKLIREITALFNDSNGQGASGLGEGLGHLFSDLAEWVSHLDSSDVQQFFAAVQGSIEATYIVTEEFFELFKGFGGPEMETPLLDFAEFVAKTMAAIVDAVRLAVLGIRMLLNELNNVFLQAQDYASSGFGATDVALRLRGKFENATGLSLPGDAMAAKIRNYRAGISAQQYQSNVDLANYQGQADDIYNGNGAYGRTKGAFKNLRNGLLAKKYGVSGTVGYTLPGQGKPFYEYAAPGSKAGSSSEDASKYVNPMGDSDLQQLMERITANSGAPNSAKTPKTPKGPKTMGQKAEDLFGKEQTKMLKDLAVAQVEYQNVLDNKNIKEGKNEAQVRSLISTDERYMAMSKEKQNTLLEYALQLDDLTLKIENATKAQQYHNDTVQEGLSAQRQVEQLRASNYASKYDEEGKLSDSFQQGGENQFVDAMNKEKMLADARKRDSQARILDMAQFQAQSHLANDEIKFQADLLGRSSEEMQKLTEFHKIDLWVAQMSVGATQQQIDEYKRLGQVMKDEVGGALDYLFKKQHDVLTSVKEAINRYIEENGNAAKNWGDVTTTALGGMEDALVSFVETGKLSFASLFQSIGKDLAKLIVRYLIVFFLQKLTGLTASGGGSGAGSMAGFGNNMDGFLGTAGGSTSTFLGGHALGGVFTNQIVSKPTYFSHGGAFGEMGEKGPEAIMPLTRNSSGQLAVHAVPSGGGDSIMNLTVEVYQGEGTGVRTEKGKNENGDVIKVIIGEVAADIARGGPVAKSITQTYGVRRTSKSYS
jgi:lambda family phage tail tape measure protein